MYNIVEVMKDNKGEIVSYKLDSGTVLDKSQAVCMAKEGKIAGVTVSVSKYGEEYLKSIPDGDKKNNLDNMTEM
ncbi:DUF3892 domain-containing protein [Haloimpatiens sp. FM7315]|uniref:DUF3892 domain-containing protein n=1 Tax=Haloimpatiens sp. FM7315 TaxID=3298609 RepID=UPI0035A26B0D